MPTQMQTVSDATRIFNTAIYPTGLTSQTAWLGIYQALLWYEPVNWAGYTSLPHIVEANNLRPSNPQRASKWTQPNIWQKRADDIERYLAKQLGCTPGEVEQKIDLLMKLPDYQGLQRQNPLGIAFIGLVKHVLETFVTSEVQYELEVDANTLFPGIQFPGRSTTPRMDILAKCNGIPRAVISAKWSLRHDRMNDITNECPIYKAAYERIYRAGGISLGYYVLTNEYQPARLDKMLSDTCIDGLVHVHKKAVVEVCRLDARLNRMLDLADFVASTDQW